MKKWVKQEWQMKYAVTRTLDGEYEESCRYIPNWKIMSTRVKSFMKYTVDKILWSFSFHIHNRESATKVWIIRRSLCFWWKESLQVGNIVECHLFQWTREGRKNSMKFYLGHWKKLESALEKNRIEKCEHVISEKFKTPL